MTLKTPKDTSNSRPHVQDEVQYGATAHQQENPALEDKVLGMFREFQAAPDWEAQEVIRDNMWRLAAGRNN